jgi:hypothetical protein
MYFNKDEQHSGCGCTLLYMEMKNYCLNVLSIMKVIMRRLIHML